MTDSNVVTLPTPSERDQQILQLRMAGVSIASIARRYRIKEKTVVATLDRLLPLIDAETRLRYVKESLVQLDALTSFWWGQARTSVAASSLYLKINESRRQLLGLDAPVRLDPIQLNIDVKQQACSTQALLDELDRIAAERSRSVPGLQVEGDPPGFCWLNYNHPHP